MNDIRQKIKELEQEKKVSRNELQTLCKEIDQQFILLEWATRTGKMLAGLNCARGKTLIVSPTHLINSMWKEKCDHKTICYASLHKEFNDYDTVILDEAQHISPKIMKILDAWLVSNPKLRFVLLSATVPYMVKVWWKRKKSFTWTISLQQAISWGIISAPEIFCVGLTLKNDKRYLLYHKGKDKTKKNLVVQYKSKEFWNNIRRKDINLQVQCTEWEWNKMVENEIAFYEEELKKNDSKIPKQVIQNKLNSLGGLRKKQLAELKNRYIRKITNYFMLEDKRVLYFCNSIPQAEFLDKRYSVHSKKKGSESLVEDFNEGIISKLISVRVLDEGISVYGVDAAVIMQVSNSVVQNVQRTGRSLLSELPQIIILYYKGTRDQEYVKKFVSQFNSDYIKWITP